VVNHFGEAVVDVAAKAKDLWYELIDNHLISIS